MGHDIHRADAQCRLARAAPSNKPPWPCSPACWLGATSIMPPCLHLPLQGVRSLCRFFLLFFMPVFFGPYWSWVHVQTNFAFAFFFSILVRVDRGCTAANLMCCGCKCLYQRCCAGVCKS